MRMPTAAKLFGCAGLATTAGITTVSLLQYLPAGTKTEGVLGVSIAFGVLLGWRVIGPARMRGYGAAVSVGCRAAFYLTICVLGFLGALQMLHRAMLMRYDGPMDALTDVIAQGAHVGLEVFRPDIVVMLFVGAVVTTMLSRWAGSRWP
ncbi:TrgA family protein [Thioclava sp. SK-1]|uniref:TrgA family protein n=1 Tax=Thioclava sp. SK-1 TaxID=1889770 RepID=UPI000825231E|nr:TrgA family protein [Thioclava sp. SK-1]